MKKILKCVLAFALLSMVFTSTAFAEGSVTDDVKTSGDATAVKNIDSANYTGVNADLVKGVNGKATKAGVKTSDLSDAVKTALTNAGAVLNENTVMTPFYNIEGPANGGTFSVNLGASLLGSAKGVSAVHVKGDGSVEVIGASSFDKAAGTATFTVSSFSPFAFIVDVEPYVYVPSKPAKKDPVVNTAAGEVNHTNYMAYAAVASVFAVGAIVIASKKLAKNAK